MSLTAVVFSRDRAMQLDLLLRSASRELDPRFPDLYVIYRASDADHKDAYDVCAREHPEVRDFIDETVGGGLPRISRRLLADSELACFLTDDSVFTRQPRIPTQLPDRVLCHSFRLGLNTTWCYPHARAQRVPRHVEAGGVMTWRWQGADGDFGYPGSVDGHVFRANLLARALSSCPERANPNGVEDHLVRWLPQHAAADHPLMSAETSSSLVGVPANRVQTTHPNRNGDRHPAHAGELCRRYLAGERIALDRLDFTDVRGAHQEIPYAYEARL